MAKITVGDVVMEGTIEELREWAELSGVEFPEAKKAEEPLKVGDFAKVCGGSVHNYNVGDIVIVNKISNGSSKGSKECVRLSDRLLQIVYGKDLVRATNEEVAEVKVEQERKAESEKWAKIGRKPKEFKKGDAIQYKKAFTTVLDVSSEGVVIKQSNNVSHSITVQSEDLTLAFPVEARFDA